MIRQVQNRSGPPQNARRDRRHLKLVLKIVNTCKLVEYSADERSSRVETLPLELSMLKMVM